MLTNLLAIKRSSFTKYWGLLTIRIAEFVDASPSRNQHVTTRIAIPLLGYSGRELLRMLLPYHSS
ncbi:hypothetical protein PUN28_003099 [Cardiocondyla obscurior]|uniref:Uncharacterized protein n=1 Tax=Cardiocondyla obscurior TaxID=286306 RepID=A0AAW2GJ32_9HYME